MCRLQKPIAYSLNEDECYYYQRDWETKYLEHLSETRPCFTWRQGKRVLISFARLILASLNLLQITYTFASPQGTDKWNSL